MSPLDWLLAAGIVDMRRVATLAALIALGLCGCSEPQLGYEGEEVQRLEHKAGKLGEETGRPAGYWAR